MLQLRAHRARNAVEAAFDEAGVGSHSPDTPQRLQVMAGYPYLLPAGIERIEDLGYDPGMHLDLSRRRRVAPDQSGPNPALIHIHGRSWGGGNRRQQARPLLHTLAEHGWLIAAVSYPLVPAAGIDEQLTALKRAVVWMRSEGRRFGADPGFIATAGGSAGGHLQLCWRSPPISRCTGRDSRPATPRFRQR